MELALALGCPSTGAMKRQMTAREYRDWQRFYEERPWGRQWDELQRALIGVNLIACWSKAKLRPVDLMPTAPPEDRQPEPMSEADLREATKSIIASDRKRHGGQSR